VSHRIIIYSNAKTALETPDVRERFTPQQCTRIDEILQSAEPPDEDFRYLARRLQQAYCADD
jgi:hypothetical protein